MIVLQNSKQIAQYVDSGGFTSMRLMLCSDGKTRVPIDLVPLAATRERMHLMSAYLQSNISSESFFNQTRSPASTPWTCTKLKPQWSKFYYHPISSVSKAKGKA